MFSARLPFVGGKLFIIIFYHIHILFMAFSFFLQKCEANAMNLHTSHGCDCMEYWTCVMSGGSPFSYCGLSESNVCCFKPAEGSSQDIHSSFGSKKQCGHKGADSGQEGTADPGEWPWHAAILEKPDDLYVCGGTLVDKNWVLTAAHCVDDYAIEKGDGLKVRLGEYDVTSTREVLLHEEYDIARIVLYPAFNNSTLAHDIALLELRQPAQRRPHIDVVCIPQKGGPFHNTTVSTDRLTQCLITGWGRRTEVTEHSVVLKEVPVPLWQNAACETALQKQFGPNYHLPSTSICAGAEEKDACDGDGGGPLVCEENGQWYQVGVISFGIGCGRENTPGVYTHVTPHEQWITSTILNHRKSSNKEN